MAVTVEVNGERRTASVSPETTLLGLLRETWGLTGAKQGCDLGDCGACTVLLDGRAVNACLALAVKVDGRRVLTVEGLADAEHLHPLQRVFEERAALQCGFCGPGILMSAKALLDANPTPSAAQVRAALAGNLCRCTGYTKIVDAILEAGRRLAASAAAAPGRDATAQRSP